MMNGMNNGWEMGLASVKPHKVDENPQKTNCSDRLLCGEEGITQL